MGQCSGVSPERLPCQAPLRGNWRPSFSSGEVMRRAVGGVIRRAVGLDAVLPLTASSLGNG